MHPSLNMKSEGFPKISKAEICVATELVDLPAAQVQTLQWTGHPGYILLLNISCGLPCKISSVEGLPSRPFFVFSDLA